VVDLPLGKMMDFVSWDDEIPKQIITIEIYAENIYPLVI